MKEELIEQILLLLMKENIDIDMSEWKNQLYLVLDEYEITSKTTAIAIRNEDRNSYCLNKFLVAKTVDGCTEKTLKNYRIEIKKILDKIGKTVDDITTDDVRYYLAIRDRRDNISKTTLDNELRYLKTFYTFLTQEEIVAKNPVARISKIRGEKIKRKAFTELDVEKIRSNCRTNRESAIVEVLLSTGCRVAELVNIKIDEIQDGSVIVHGKGEKDRICYLNAKACLAIEQYLNERKDENPYLFAGGILGSGLATHYYSKCKEKRKLCNWYRYPEFVSSKKPIDVGSIESTVRRIGNRAGVENVYPHRFRRTCATFALRRGMPLEQVSKMLGHEQLSTTQIYLDLTEKDLELSHRKYVV